MPSMRRLYFPACLISHTGFTGLLFLQHSFICHCFPRVMIQAYLSIHLIQVELEFNESGNFVLFIQGLLPMVMSQFIKLLMTDIGYHGSLSEMRLNNCIIKYRLIVFCCIYSRWLEKTIFTTISAVDCSENFNSSCIPHIKITYIWICATDERKHHINCVSTEILWPSSLIICMPLAWQAHLLQRSCYGDFLSVV